MKRERLRVYITICLVISICSCGESFFSPETGSLNEIAVLSLANGGTIEVGENLSFQITSTAEDEKPDRLLVNLYSSDGEQLGTLSNSSFALNEPLSLNLFDTLETGRYTVEFLLYSDSVMISEKKMTFFYVREQYGITGIESFPPVIFPGATVLLTALLTVPESSNPYLRWTINDTVIAKGTIREGLNKILWSAPEEEGIFTVRIELFPIEPPGTDDFPFESDIFMDVELFVTKAGKPSNKRLKPADSYYALYHFEGDLFDSGKGSPPVIEDKYRGGATPIGEPELITTDEDFGYALKPGEGFMITENILPVKEGRLTPFTLSLGLLLEPDQEGKNIIRISSLDNLFSLAVYIDKDGTFFAGLQSGMKEVFIPSKINVNLLQKRFLLSLSFIPIEKTLKALWFLDGIQMGDFTVNDINLEIMTSGETIIGGENGIGGIIDECGVYFRDPQGRAAINPDLYEDAIRQLYDDNTLFAQGFDGLYLPEDVVVEGDDRIDTGKLFLTTSLSIVISPLNIQYEDVSIIVRYAEPVHDNSKISLFWEGSDTPFIDSFSNGQVAAGGELQSFRLKNNGNSFYIKVSSFGRKAVFVNEEKPVDVAIGKPSKKPERMILKIINNDDEAVVIDSITVLKNRE
ncbi:MAG: hypothetical protein JW881_09085 [Spirochaetales bacterium]|nr:hypothetical protein [Spirochaetales bacterium]